MLLNVSCIGRNDVPRNERAIGQGRAQENLVRRLLRVGRDRVRLIPDTSLSRLRIFAPAPLEEGKRFLRRKKCGIRQDV